MTLLELEAVTAGYQGGAVLHDVDLTAEPGKITAVVGHNGAGKSTLMQVIAGLLPAEGTVRWDSRVVTGWPVHRRARAGIGYVPQGRRVFGTVTVAEHIAISRRRGSEWTPDRIWEMFPRLAQRRRSRGAQLSGGEQQMLAVARALLTGPRVLLLDEPTEGLAPVVVQQIQETVSRLARSGMAIVLAAPQPRWPIAVADKLCVLDNGRVTHVFDGEDVRSDGSAVYAALALDSSGVAVHPASADESA